MRQQHGSGKTAVLVERIIHKILVEKLDITSLLVVTFTNAAAAEMRERVLNAIDKKLEEFPEDVHLQKQTMLIHKASICTIHSFCLDVIKNHFYEIDLSPNFRIGDTSEIELLKQEVLDELFEQKYLEGDKNFLKLLEFYTNYREDDPLKDMILEMIENENKALIRKGRREGRRETLKYIAKRMLNEKVDIDFIMRITGLTKEQILK